MSWVSRFRFRVFSLRIEELVAFLFFPPMVYFTFKAHSFFATQGYVPVLFRGDLQRLLIVIVVFFLFLLAVKFKPGWKVIRDGLPFGLCIAIYTNLHDTIYFANPHDIHNSLIKIDRALFGFQPCVWAEQFIHPVLTDIFTFCYFMFFIWAPLVAAILYFKKEYQKFRYTMVSVIFCFYIGYIGYVLWPAAPPRITLAPLFTKTLQGIPILDSARHWAEVLPTSNRGVFPSLHCAATIVALIFAWKYLRKAFWFILPFAVGLILSTIYLRHHYVIDLIAGIALAFFSAWLGPKIEEFWRRLQLRYGKPGDSILTSTPLLKQVRKPSPLP